MSGRSAPPFRADQVGSLLRPRHLLEARERHARGEIDDQALRVMEDRAIVDAIQMQESVGLKAITDGELRRGYFHLDFLERLEGVSTEVPREVVGADGRRTLAPSEIRVTARVRHAHDIQRADFQYLAQHLSAGHIGKVTLPSPTMLHFRSGRAGISTQHYPRLDPEFYADVAEAYGAELRSLAAAGCRYVQLDDTNLAYLCDPAMREATKARGEDPDELPHLYARLINRIVAAKPAGMTLAIHLCRGNFRSTWAASGGYAPIAEALFGEMDVDGYFLEFDDERSGDFQPLRHLRPGRIAVLGLLTTKRGELERPEDLRRRIDEAARHAPLDQLALSPQCGFSSTLHGNAIDSEQQRAKLALTVQTALQVWGAL